MLGWGEGVGGGGGGGGGGKGVGEGVGEGANKLTISLFENKRPHDARQTDPILRIS